MRSALGNEALCSVADDLRLYAADLECDVWSFEEAAHEQDLARAAATYDGPFLEGFRLARSAPFEKWVDRERARLRERYCDVLEALAEEAGSRGELDDAAGWWRRRVQEEPSDSRVTRRLMVALAGAGNPLAGVRVGRTHARLLREELDLEPDAEVLSLTERLRALAASPGSAIGVQTAVVVSPGAAALEGTPGRSGSDDGGSVRRDPSLDRNAVAVLPFASIGGGEEAESFATGLHSDLLTRLGRVPALAVISRTSVLHVRDAATSIPEIGRALGVGSIVEGSVRVSGGSVRLNVQLIDARKDVQRWADAYDRRLTSEDVFDIQTEVVESIAANLEARLRPHGPGPLAARNPTDELEAFRSASLGYARMDQRTGSAMQEAAGHFQKAIELDPELPAAHASLMLLHDTRFDGPAAVRTLQRAVELQPSYAEAYN